VDVDAFDTVVGVGWCKESDKGSVGGVMVSGVDQWELG
jgi:hypothetical protein